MNNKYKAEVCELYGSAEAYREHEQKQRIIQKRIGQKQTME